MIFRIFQGFCMGIADSVPGISGGTIAFLMGFYTTFLDSLRNLLRGNRAEKKEAFLFLVKLGIGWVIGLGLCVVLLANLFEQHIYAVSSLFVGLTLFAIPVIIKEERHCFTGRHWRIVFTVIGLAVVVMLSVLRDTTQLGIVVNPLDLTVSGGLVVILSAALAISAMILPGISGSSLLLITGMYMPVIRALDATLHLDLRYIPFLLLFIAGIVVGLIGSIGLVRAAMRKYRSQMMHLIIGLMLGSVYSIFSGPTTLEIPQPAMTLSTFNVVMFLVGGMLILLLEWYKHRSKTRKAGELS